MILQRDIASKRRVHIILLVVLLAALSLVMAWVASAGCGPHGGYQASTDACAACHLSHTGPGAGLATNTPGQPICYKCHQDAHNGGQDCLGCHDPHRCEIPNNVLRLNTVLGAAGSTQLAATFSGGAYANQGSIGSLEPSAFTITTTGGQKTATSADNQRTILGVSHTAGTDRALLTLDSALTESDLGVEAVAPVSGTIYDAQDRTIVTNPVRVTAIGGCPPGNTRFDFNDPAGSPFVLDERGLLVGAVVSPTEALRGDGNFTGDGANSHINFAMNDTCLQASTSLTIEMRIKPTEIPATGRYVKSVFVRGQSSNYEVSVWRDNLWLTFDPPGGVASLAFWLKPAQPNSGSTWKAVLTDYDTCPLVSNHWYAAKVTWNSNKIGGIPGNIYVEDQGTDGLGLGQNWTGVADCTDSDQSQLPVDARLAEGDTIEPANANFTIGASLDDLSASTFNGLIDWISLEADASQYLAPRRLLRSGRIYLPMIIRQAVP
jgi:predicted CXXCH cytochrome family protein